MIKYAVSFLCLSLALGMSGGARAQLAFWNYDDGDNATAIPAECDGVFDEVRGGVFLPTPEEMREQGEKFLLNSNPEERNKAGYCLIAAALQGDVSAQYRVAQLYNKGIVLPQDELSAYKWAFIASLNGNKDADRLALLLERFLTTEDIERATSSIQTLVPTIHNKYQKELAEQEKRVEEKQAQLDEINAEIDSILGINTKDVVMRKSRRKADTASVTAASKKQSSGTATGAGRRRSGVPQGRVFSEADRPK